MATFFEKLLRMPNRTVRIGNASAQSNITFPFSKNPVELSEPQFNRLTELATNRLAETAKSLAVLIGFDIAEVNEYSFYVTVEKSTQMKWFVQSLRFNGKRIRLVEVIGFVDEIGIRGGVMALEPCRILRHNDLVWANGLQYVPPFNNYSIAQFIYSYVHHNFSWKDHNENVRTAEQIGAEYRTNPHPLN